MIVKIIIVILICLAFCGLLFAEDELKYNPYQNKWSYERPESEIIYNPYEKKFEYGQDFPKYNPYNNKFEVQK